MEKIKGVAPTNIVPLKRSNPLVSKGYESIISDWLARFDSRHTVRVYRHAVKEFLNWVGDNTYSPEVLRQFLLLEQAQAIELVSQYEGYLVKQSFAPATINRKLASIKSLVNYASSVGKCYYSLSDLKSKSVTIYRDTSGISTETFKQMLDTVNRATLKGKRDYAILLLLWGNALRRSEVTTCLIKHFEPTEKRLWILGKGKKGQLQSVTLGDATLTAISQWLSARYDYELQLNNEQCLARELPKKGDLEVELNDLLCNEGKKQNGVSRKNEQSESSLMERDDNLKTSSLISDSLSVNRISNESKISDSLSVNRISNESPISRLVSVTRISNESKIHLQPEGIIDSNDSLFCAVHKGYWGHQLNTDSIYKLVKKYANLAGIQKTLSPHRLRHSAITAALEATNGDVRSVQKLSRHSSLNTLMIYDDNRRNEQGRVTNILESLL